MDVRRSATGQLLDHLGIPGQREIHPDKEHTENVKLKFMRTLCTYMSVDWLSDRDKHLPCSCCCRLLVPAALPISNPVDLVLRELQQQQQVFV